MLIKTYDIILRCAIYISIFDSKKIGQIFSNRHKKQSLYHIHIVQVNLI